MLGKPWWADPADIVEQTALLAAAPGFDLTLLETLDRQAAGLTEIRCPVLVLWGTRDMVLIPRQGRRFARLIPNCELRYLKGLGHVPMSDDPELLATAIADFALARPGVGAITNDPDLVSSRDTKPATLSRKPRR
jgi:pimeloyl-ACP methyl ester carboxylesterase